MRARVLASAAWAALVAWGSGARAEDLPAPGLAMTIYANNIALVQDTRSLDIAGGRQTIEFKDVSAQIRPETVNLTATGLDIVEQNFDFDLLSPAKMMEKAVGHVVTIVRTNPATGAETREQAEVLAANEGVVLRIGDRIEVLRDDGLPVRVIFDKVPDNLRASPTLSVTVSATRGGARPGVLSYLTPGLGWRADYVALYDDAAGKIDVQGWVTLTNSSGTTYKDAKTVLVAGTPSLVDTPQSYQPRVSDNPIQQAGTESGSRERLGDFYLYPLAERTTIANQQTKQVSFLDVHGAEASHGYEYHVNWLQSLEQPASAKSVYRFSNGSKGGLGDQLPAGIVRFYISDRTGAPQFIGENRIDNTPMGSELALATGDAFDVKVKSEVQHREAHGLFRWTTTMHYVLTNALPKPVTVSLVQDGLWGDTRIVSESLVSRRRDADRTQWEVAIPANGKSELTATFDTRY